MFVEIRLAMKVRTCESGTWIPSVFTFLRRIAMRVSRSGAWMSVMRPHSNRDRSRASRVAIALLEPLDPLVAQRVDEVVHERLARDVASGEMTRVLGDVPGDRLQEVSLAETRTAVDEEWVVRLRGSFGDRKRGRVGEAVRRADHEGVEGVLRIQALGAPRRRRFLGLGDTARLADDHAHGPLVSERFLHGGLDQAQEMPLDPLAREVVGHGDDERLVLDCPLRVLEPGAERRVVESFPETA